MLAMYKTALLLSCLECTVFARRVNAPAEPTTRVKSEDSNPLSSLSTLLLSLDTVAGKVSSPKAGLPARSPNIESWRRRGAAVMQNKNEEEEEKVDIYRDTILRYAGYLNEVGEAFRPIVPGEAVTLSYVLAISYVLADALSKGGETAEAPANQGVKGCGAAAVIDVLTFQFLASIIFPSAIINRAVALTVFSEQKFDALGALQNFFSAAADQALLSLGPVTITPGSIEETLPTVVGLALIPFIAPPIDEFVEETILDGVVRPKLLSSFPNCQLPLCARLCAILEEEDGVPRNTR